MLPYPWCHLNYRHENPCQSLLCALPVESTAAITSGARLPLLPPPRVQGEARGCSFRSRSLRGLHLPALSGRGPRGPYFSRSTLFPACIVSRLFVRVNTAGAFLCGLRYRVGLLGRFVLLGTMAAQTIQNAALALQGKTMFCHQVGAHLVHEVAVQMIDAPALHALEV